VAAWPIAARAQPGERVRRIGYLVFTSPSAHAKNSQAFRASLRDLGYVEGKNVVIEFRFAEGNNQRVSDLAAELIRLNLDVLVTYGPAVPAVQRATSTIPIVMATYGDALASGLIASLANPGGNLTGLTFFNPELMSKRLELLKDIKPSMTGTGVLLNPDTIANAAILDAMNTTAHALKVQLQVCYAREPSEFESVFSAMTDSQIGATVIHDHPLFITNATAIAALAAKHRLASSGFLELPMEGGLMAYGVNFPDRFRRAAVFVDKIFKGSKPSNLPVERSTKFDLVINLNTARTIGLDVPPMLLARADEVIE
jgi:putative tryptophan/tyrosine transport system substrate-binding protein